MYFKDLQGQKFGMLTVCEHCGSDKNHQALWRCKCECGSEVVVKGHNLRKGLTRSCGCLKNRLSSERWTTHGESCSRLYGIWEAIKSRCYYTKHRSFRHYGGRGITMCDDWRNNFVAFKEWAIASGYADDLTIDRIDVNGNYEPSNCRWATSKEQSNNRRNSLSFDYHGKQVTIAELSEMCGIPSNVLHYRLTHNWSVEEAMTTEVRKRGR